MGKSPPKFLVYSATTSDTIQQSLGESEYSYYFVLKSYLPVLRQLGEVEVITDPANEVDPRFHQCHAEGRYCVFLAFCQPNQLNLELECPTIPVFAWEFENIPDEVWDNDIRTDWRYSLSRAGWAITHSSHTVRNVQRHVRGDFPLVSAPSPLWDHYASMSRELRGPNIDMAFTISAERGYVIDTREVDLNNYSPENLPEASAPPPLASPLDIQLSGAVYTTILNPRDGRKNWMDIIWAFCWALKDREDATLVLKLTCTDPELVLVDLLHDLYKLTPFSCRVVAIAGYLSDEAYEQLAVNTSIAVNASRGEGQCLPLMEYMSAGVPAIAPLHTGLLDYINADNAFLLETSLEPTHWPHDPREYYRTQRHRVDWASLVEAYKDSYRTIKEDPKRYRAMSAAANRSLKAHCSLKVVRNTLAGFFRQHRRLSELYGGKVEGKTLFGEWPLRLRRFFRAG